MTAAKLTEVKNQNSKAKGGFDPLNWVLLLVAAGAIGAVSYLSISAWNDVEEDVVTGVQTKTQGELSGIPSLKLNQDHTRQGPTVTVDPSQIGKDNPFSR